MRKIWLKEHCLRRKILSTHPYLLKSINPEALNHIIKGGECKGRSCAYWLCSSIQVREILSAHPHLIKKIKETTLSHIIQKGEYTDESAAFSLSTTEKGREVLLSNKSLINKINKTSLNHIDEENQSVLSILCLPPTGKQIVKMIPDIASKINYEAIDKLESDHKTAVKLDFFIKLFLVLSSK